MQFRLWLAGIAAKEFGLGPLSGAVYATEVSVGEAVGETAAGEPVGGRGGEFRDLVAGSRGDRTNGAANIDVRTEVVRVLPGGLSDLAYKIGCGPADRLQLVPFWRVGQGNCAGFKVSNSADCLTEKTGCFLDSRLMATVLMRFG